MQPLQTLAEAQSLAMAVMDAAIEPFVVLDDQIRLVAASRSFYETFEIAPGQAYGVLLYDLGQRDWDIPALRAMLAAVIPDRSKVDGFELTHEFGSLGTRTLVLNARVVPLTDAGPTILLAIKDVTARRAIEMEKQKLLEDTAELLDQQRVLFKEMQHRVANSLQIIASILMLKARGVASQETRDHLADAHQRVMSVAAVQSHLHSVDGIDRIDLRAYLTELCHGLASSMIGSDKPIALEVTASEGTTGSAQAVSLGLIVTELVINAIKYAFPVATPDARILVAYAAGEDGWSLSVSDNGVGKSIAQPIPGGGLGTAIVAALSKQLDADMSLASDAPGLTVTVASRPVEAVAPLAA
jgi:two-component sensor histidine kinase